VTARVTGKARAPQRQGMLPVSGAPELHDYYLPFRRVDLLSSMLRDQRVVATAERSRFLRFNLLLGSIFHIESIAQLETLREIYHPADPDFAAGEGQDADSLAARCSEFMGVLVPLLRKANYVEIPIDEIERAHAEDAAVRLKISTPLEDFHAVRFFRRGRGLETFDVKDRLGLRVRNIDVEVYRNVVLVAAVKADGALDRKQRERLQNANIRPGSILIKGFRDIASADLNALLPNVRINMSTFDKLTMAIPALVGGVPIMLKLVSTLTVLFVVVGFYLGFQGSVRDEEVNTAIAALGALVALGAFVIRQWVRYERQSLRYLKELTEKVFSRRIVQNAEFFDYILGAVEDQDRKEALLAYAFLRNGNEPQAPSDLRIEVENWLKRHLDIVSRFEVLDAIAKLDRLGLVKRTANGYAAKPLDEALAQVRRVWQEFHPPAEPHQEDVAGLSR
jgi:hypothetical protein